MPTLTDRLVKDLANRSDLPALPAVAMRLLATLGQDDAYMDDIAEIIRHDPAIAGLVLSAANSIGLGGRTKVETISAALPRLGLLHVRRLALIASTRAALPVDPRLFPHRSFWVHSVAVAHASVLIVDRMKTVPVETDPEVLFLAGLLHDLGLLVLACYCPAEYAAIAHDADVKGVSFYNAELAALSGDHGELGGLVASHWALPGQVVTAIRTHHWPRRGDPPYRWIARVVHLADSLVSKVVTEFPHGAPDDFDPTTGEVLGIRPAVLAQICADIRVDVRRAAFMWLAPLA